MLRWSRSTRRRTSLSIGIDGSAATTSHSEAEGESSGVPRASDMIQLLQLQGVQACDHTGGLDYPRHGRVVEQAGSQGCPQDTEVLVVASRVVTQEGDLVVGEAETLLQMVCPAGCLPHA